MIHKARPLNKKTENFVRKIKNRQILGNKNSNEKKKKMQNAYIVTKYQYLNTLTNSRRFMLQLYVTYIDCLINVDGICVLENYLRGTLLRIVICLHNDCLLH